MKKLKKKQLKPQLKPQLKKLSLKKRSKNNQQNNMPKEKIIKAEPVKDIIINPLELNVSNQLHTTGGEIQAIVDKLNEAISQINK